MILVHSIDIYVRDGLSGALLQCLSHLVQILADFSAMNDFTLLVSRHVSNSNLLHFCAVKFVLTPLIGITLPEL